MKVQIVYILALATMSGFGGLVPLNAQEAPALGLKIKVDQSGEGQLLVKSLPKNKGDDLREGRESCEASSERPCKYIVPCPAMDSPRKVDFESYPFRGSLSDYPEIKRAMADKGVFVDKLENSDFAVILATSEVASVKLGRRVRRQGVEAIDLSGLVVQNEPGKSYFILTGVRDIKPIPIVPPKGCYVPCEPDDPCGKAQN